MKNLISGNLTIEVKIIDNKYKVLWIGKSDKREPASVLIPFLTDLVEEFAGNEVEVIFTKLKYMNSSTVVPIIQFMKNLADKSFKSTFIFNKESNWQVATFKAFMTLARNMKNIEVIGREEGSEQ